ncbi:MAG TPA: MFS transporter, partial [Niabella sp.]|nr:MFS transporter [Niabella sp.]
GWILFLFHYNPELPKQAMETIFGERLMISLLPAVCCVIAFIGMSFYPLNEKKVKEIATELQRRRIQ